MAKGSKQGKDFLDGMKDDLLKRVVVLEEELKKINEVLALISIDVPADSSDYIDVPEINGQPRRGRNVRKKWYDHFKNRVTLGKVHGEIVLKDEMRSAGSEGMSVRRALGQLHEEGLLTRTGGTARSGYVYSWNRLESLGYSTPSIKGEEVTLLKARPVRFNVGGMAPRAAEVSRHVKGEVEVRRVTSQGVQKT